MKTIILAVLGCISLASGSAFAGQTFKAEVDFVNPNGCRVFDMVVDPNCDYNLTTDRCSTLETIVKAVGQQVPELQISASCARIHTGNFFARMLDELMMNSTSFDGYKLNVKATESKQPNPSAVVQTTDAAACADGVSAFESLASQGLKVSAVCDANELRVQFAN
jgi:hypothetical protein